MFLTNVFVVLTKHVYEHGHMIYMLNLFIYLLIYGFIDLFFGPVCDIYEICEVRGICHICGICHI